MNISELMKKLDILGDNGVANYLYSSNSVFLNGWLFVVIQGGTKGGEKGNRIRMLGKHQNK